MELIQKLAQTFSQFITNSDFKSFETFSSGHINDTYLIRTNTPTHYVLQRINGTIFKKAKEVISNKVSIANHLLEKEITSLKYYQTKENNYYYIDNQNHYWCLTKYIKNSQTFVKATSTKMAYQAGFATGLFLAQTQDFKEELVEILPKFHSMSFRFIQFKEALTSADKSKKENVQKWIDFALSKESEMLVLDYAITNNQIPLRVTHNDTKISNILFNSNQKAICLIDLDTVMKGCIHFDFGDAIRTICSTATEDETDISKIDFNFNYFKSYSRGFFQNLQNNLFKEEIDLLGQSPKIMTFIMGLRFLTDYLNNNIYYKIAYPKHNLDRAINQFILVKKISKQQAIIDKYIQTMC